MAYGQRPACDYEPLRKNAVGSVRSGEASSCASAIWFTIGQVEKPSLACSTCLCGLFSERFSGGRGVPRRCALFHSPGRWECQVCAVMTGIRGMLAGTGTKSS